MNAPQQRGPAPWGIERRRQASRRLFTSLEPGGRTGVNSVSAQRTSAAPALGTDSDSLQLNVPRAGHGVWTAQADALPGFERVVLRELSGVPRVARARTIPAVNAADLKGWRVIMPDRSGRTTVTVSHIKLYRDGNKDRCTTTSLNAWTLRPRLPPESLGQSTARSARRRGSVMLSGERVSGSSRSQRASHGCPAAGRQTGAARLVAGLGAAEVLRLYTWPRRATAIHVTLPVWHP